MVRTQRLAALVSALGTMGLLAVLPAPARAFTQRGVGVVTALRGEAAVAHAPEVAARERRPPQEPLKFRDDVFFRDTIDTQRESAAKLLLRGRATFTIRELSRVELREGVVPADPTRTRSIVNLLAGAFRAVVQRDLRPQDELEVQTPNAISAIRGSDLVFVFYLPGQIPPDVLREVMGFLPPGTPPPGPDEQVTLVWIREAQGEIVNPTAPGQPRVGMANNVLVAVIGRRPPILALAVPDAVDRVASRFVLLDVVGPLGAHLARHVAAHQSRARGDAGGGGAFQAGELPSLSGLVNALTVATNQDVVINVTLSGFGDFLGNFFDFNNSAIFGSVNGFFSPGGAGGVTGSLSGRFRLFGGPGTLTLTLTCSVCGVTTFQTTVTGNFFFLGKGPVGMGSGSATCTGPSCFGINRADVTFQR